MSRRARRNQAAAFKAKVVLETARVEQPLTQRAQRLDLHPKWKNQLLDRATEVLAKSSKPADPPIDVKTLQAKIGQLSLENDFLAGRLTKAGLLSAKR